MKIHHFNIVENVVKSSYFPSLFGFCNRQWISIFKIEKLYLHKHPLYLNKPTVHQSLLDIPQCSWYQFQHITYCCWSRNYHVCQYFLTSIAGWWQVVALLLGELSKENLQHQSYPNLNRILLFYLNKLYDSL